MASILNRIFVPRVSVRIYGLAAVVFGLVGLLWGDFAVMWQPDPDGVPGQSTLGYAVSIAPLLAGLAMKWRRTAGPGALALTVFYSLGVMLLDVPRVFAHPSVFVTWCDAQRGRIRVPSRTDISISSGASECGK